MADPGLPQIDNHRRSNQKDCPKLPNYQGESHPRSRGGETWDQSVSYRQNLGTGSPALLGYRNEQYPSTSTPQQRPSWEGEKLPARNLPNQRRSDIDITRKHPEQDQIKQTLAHPSKLHVHRYPANSGSPAALTSKMRSYKDTRPPDVTMLMDAVKSSNTQDIRRILDKGVDVNSKELGYTAMHLACQLGHIDTIEYLLFCGADISIRDQNGQTPGFYSKLKGV
uniref:Uncharacterized protein n=1 Tax=Ciona savignyi TaxID=51511 RepID=H2Z9B6_CIOSA